MLYLPGRLSAVVEEREGKWLFAHLHIHYLPLDQEKKGKPGLSRNH